jgi:hypothetical protein
VASVASCWITRFFRFLQLFSGFCTPHWSERKLLTKNEHGFYYQREGHRMTAAVKACPSGKRSAEHSSANRGDPELGSGSGFDGSRSEFDESASHQTKSNQIKPHIKFHRTENGRGRQSNALRSDRGKSWQIVLADNNGVPAPWSAAALLSFAEKNIFAKRTQTHIGIQGVTKR